MSLTRGLVSLVRLARLCKETIDAEVVAVSKLALAMLCQNQQACFKRFSSLLPSTLQVRTNIFLCSEVLHRMSGLLLLASSPCKHAVMPSHSATKLLLQDRVRKHVG